MSASSKTRRVSFLKSPGEAHVIILAGPNRCLTIMDIGQWRGLGRHTISFCGPSSSLAIKATAKVLGTLVTLFGPPHLQGPMIGDRSFRLIMDYTHALERSIHCTGLNDVRKSILLMDHIPSLA